MSQVSGERRRQLVSARVPFSRFPMSEYFELPGRPNVIYTIVDYGRYGPYVNRIGNELSSSLCNGMDWMLCYHWSLVNWHKLINIKFNFSCVHCNGLTGSHLSISALSCHPVDRMLYPDADPPSVYTPSPAPDVWLHYLIVLTAESLTHSCI